MSEEMHPYTVLLGVGVDADRQEQVLDAVDMVLDALEISGLEQAVLVLSLLIDVCVHQGDLEVQLRAAEAIHKQAVMTLQQRAMLPMGRCPDGHTH